MSKTAAEWKAWNDQETDGEALERGIRELIADLTAMEKLAIGGEGETHFYYKAAFADCIDKCAKERERAEKAEAGRAYFEGCYNQWRGAVDIAEHEGMQWKDQAEVAKREIDRLRDAMAEQSRQDKGAIDGMRAERDRLQAESTNAIKVVAELIAERDALKVGNAKLPEHWYSPETMAAVVKERDALRLRYARTRQALYAYMLKDPSNRSVEESLEYKQASSAYFEEE